MRFSNVHHITGYVSKLNDSQVTTKEINSIHADVTLVMSSLIFYGCNSPDDDNFDYYMIGNNDKIIFYYNCHESEIRLGALDVKQFVLQHISDIKKIVIFHDHCCASDCDYNEYVKIINII